MIIEQESMGVTPEGAKVSLFTLSHSSGFEVKVTDWGATITSILAADKKGCFRNVVLGYDKLESYFVNKPYLGSTVGRYCNRIANGQFTLNGKTYTLTQNEGENHLHGGSPGFSHCLWESSIEDNSVIMRLQSVDGDQGYPGNLNVCVRFKITTKQALQISYEAKSDADTILNLTNHSYFNLGGEVQQDTSEHVLQIPSNHWLPMSDNGIPTGEILPVENTNADFRHPQKIGRHNFNHYFSLNNYSEQKLSAVLTDPQSGRFLEVRTDQPGIQLYNGYALDEKEGQNGSNFGPYSGVCLETQSPANAPNQSKHSNTILKKNTTFQSKTTLTFKTTHQDNPFLIL